MSKYSRKIKRIQGELLIEGIEEDKDFFIREWEAMNEEEAVGQKQPTDKITN